MKKFGRGGEREEGYSRGGGGGAYLLFWLIGWVLTCIRVWVLIQGNTVFYYRVVIYLRIVVQNKQTHSVMISGSAVFSYYAIKTARHVLKEQTCNQQSND